MTDSQIRIITNAGYPSLPSVPVVPQATTTIEKNGVIIDVNSTINTTIIPPVKSSNDVVYKQITFADGVTMIITKEWYDKYEKLQVPIILRNGLLFKNIIYPLLTKEPLIYLKQGNPFEEFSQILSEINYYGVSLASEQMYDIASNCGLVDFMQTTKEYITSKTYGINNYHRGYKKRFDKFCEDWKQYLDILISRYPNDKMERFIADSLTEMLLSFDFQTLFVINMQMHNVIFEYVDWFNKVVIKKDIKSLSNYIEGIIVHKNSNVNSWIESQLLNLPVQNTIKSKITTIMNNASIMNDFIKYMNNKK